MHRLKITDLSRGGAGIARLETGQVVFVPLTAPGDIIDVEIIETKKNFHQGKLVQIVEPSPLRINPPCPVFSECGGCTWQHLPDSLQWQTKVKGLAHSLSRTGIKDLPEVEEFPAKNTYFYRNRIQLRGTVLPDRSVELGFYKRGTHDVVAISDCKIARPEINEAIQQIRKAGTERAPKRLGEFKVEIEVDDQGVVREAFNRKHGAFGFRQVNTEQNQILRKWVVDKTSESVPSEIRSKTVLLDLYGGTGNLSQDLSPRFYRTEIVDVGAPRSVAAENVGTHPMAVSNWLRSQNFEADRPIMIISDPPRTGWAEDLNELYPHLKVWLEKGLLLGLIVVGCDADSFSRDIARLLQKGLELRSLGAIDLFPQTPHLESLALLRPPALT